eukprot:scaffold2026_cov78-Cylindrotheca_fusiformis.AAC.6
MIPVRPSSLILATVAAVVCLLPSTSFGFSTNKPEALFAKCSVARRTSSYHDALTETRLLQSSRSIVSSPHHRDGQIFPLSSDTISSQSRAWEQSFGKLRALATNFVSIFTTFYHQILSSIKSLTVATADSVAGFTTSSCHLVTAPNRVLFQQYVLANTFSPEGAFPPDSQHQTYEPSSQTDEGDRLLQSKYAAIESLEERAFQICQDLKIV